MKAIKKETKRGHELLRTASIYEGDTLYHVYDSFSEEKARSFEECKKMCYEENGYCFHICSHNTFTYSVAWNVIIDGEEATRMETAYNSYIIK